MKRHVNRDTIDDFLEDPMQGFWVLSEVVNLPVFMQKVSTNHTKVNGAYGSAQK